MAGSCNIACSPSFFHCVSYIEAIANLPANVPHHAAPSGGVPIAVKVPHDLDRKSCVCASLLHRQACAGKLLKIQIEELNLASLVLPLGAG